VVSLADGIQCDHSNVHGQRSYWSLTWCIRLQHGNCLHAFNSPPKVNTRAEKIFLCAKRTDEESRLRSYFVPIVDETVLWAIHWKIKWALSSLLNQIVFPSVRYAHQTRLFEKNEMTWIDGLGCMIWVRK
jgi:hypothetical protein